MPSGYARIPTSSISITTFSSKGGPTCAPPSSIGKYEFEIVSGAAILIGGIRMLARAWLYKRSATALQLSSGLRDGVIPASTAALF